MKVIVAGNSNYGLAKSLANVFENNDVWAEFYSKSNGGYDFLEQQKQKLFAEQSISYDVVILCSYIKNFSQVRLLEKIARLWFEQNKEGQIIVVGSTADLNTKGNTNIYPVEKKALKHYCRQLSISAAGDDGHRIRTTYIAPGNMHTPSQDKKLPQKKKLDCDYVAGLIYWLMQQPKQVVISELSLDRVPAY